MAWSDDALFCGRLIAARLRDQVPALRAVDQIDEMDPDVVQRRTPAAVVMFDRETLSSDADARRATKQIVTQRWMIFVVVRSARQKTGVDSELAGPYISAIARALQGWTPAGAHRPLVRASGGAADQVNDMRYYPLAFDIQLIAE